MGWAHAAALGSFLALGVIADVRRRRVPNRLVAAATIGALLVAGAGDGTSGVGSGICGFAVGVVLLLVPFAFGYVGGGDAKFLGTVGAFLGPRLTFDAFLVGSLLGGILALVARQAPGHRAPAVPYTAPLAAGVVLALVLDEVGLGLV